METEHLHAQEDNLRCGWEERLMCGGAGVHTQEVPQPTYQPGVGKKRARNLIQSPPRRQPASSHITIQELTIGCCRLKATLSEALAAQDKTSQRPSLHTESPADMAIRLLDNLITGDEVRAGRRLAFMHPWGMGPSGNPLKGSRPIPQGGGRQALLVQHLCLNSYCRSVITHHAEVINVNAPPSCKAMNVRLLSLGRVPCSAKVSMYVLLS